MVCAYTYICIFIYIYIYIYIYICICVCIYIYIYRKEPRGDYFFHWTHTKTIGFVTVLPFVTFFYLQNQWFFDALIQSTGRVIISRRHRPPTPRFLFKVFGPERFLLFLEAFFVFDSFWTFFHSFFMFLEVFGSKNSKNLQKPQKPQKNKKTSPAQTL